MSANDILATFMKMFFSIYAEHVKSYRKSGRNSIRIELEDTRELIFTYHDENDWALRTAYHAPQKVGV